MKEIYKRTDILGIIFYDINIENYYTFKEAVEKRNVQFVTDEINIYISYNEKTLKTVMFNVKPFNYGILENSLKRYNELLSNINGISFIPYNIIYTLIEENFPEFLKKFTSKEIEDYTNKFLKKEIIENKPLKENTVVKEARIVIKPKNIKTDILNENFNYLIENKGTFQHLTEKNKYVKVSTVLNSKFYERKAVYNSDSVKLIKVPKTENYFKRESVLHDFQEDLNLNNEFKFDSVMAEKIFLMYNPIPEKKETFINKIREKLVEYKKDLDKIMHEEQI